MSAISPISPPWQIKHDFDLEGATTIIGNVDGEIVDGTTHYSYDFICTTVDPDESVQARGVCIANAAFIVRACNSHAELLAAAKRALNFIANTEGELGITLDSGDALRAAIAKATGEA